MNYRCLADMSGPFFDPDKPFRNWSALPFYQLDQPTPPYVDQRQLAHGLERATAYLRRIHDQGYTGFVIDNLAHLVGFEDAPVVIYPTDSPYRQRAAIYRQAFAQLFDVATQLGMELFVTTDMQWSTPPVRRYVGRLKAGNPRLIALNRWALLELFTRFPQVRGLVVRVGETGGAHDQGQDYTGHMLYTSVSSLRNLIATLLSVCEAHNRLLIIRTWSIGIGDLGDLLWSPACYREVFAGYTSSHLLVSIKHGPADFFRILPPNPTLGIAGPAQIIELQNRREYELFGMVPAAVVPLHQEVIQHAHRTNRHFAGVWAWNSLGGWGGGRATLGTTGWSIWTELSSALTAALSQTPDRDAAAFVQRWCDDLFGQPFGAAVADVYLESGTLLEQGWYPGQLTYGVQTLGTIYLPPLLWVWWMRPTASLVIWAYLALAVHDRDAVLRASQAACERVAWHAERLSRLAPADCPLAVTVVTSVAYFHNMLVVAHTIRALLLPLFEAAWMARRVEWKMLAVDLMQARAVLRLHCVRWDTHPDFPPLELAEIEHFLEALEHTPGLLWVRTRMACMLIERLRTWQRLGRRARISGMLVAAVLVSLLVYEGHPRVGAIGALASILVVSPLRRRAISLALPWLNRRLNLLPSMFFESGPAFTEWMA